MNKLASLIGGIVRWVFALGALVLLARLALTLANLAFNFSETPIGWLIYQGSLLERIRDASPQKLAIQIAISAAIVTILLISKRAARDSSERALREHNDHA
jgi:hypothetical protein